MAKLIASSIVVALLVGSVCFGEIGTVQNYQDWGLGLSNSNTVLSGTVTASTLQTVGNLSIQTGSSTTGTSASQGLGAALIQGNTIDTTHAPMSVTQTLSASGAALGHTDPVTGDFVADTASGQDQSVGLGAGLISQFEGAQVTGTQTLTKSVGGDGSTTAGQGVGYAMGQTANNSSSSASQGTIVAGGQIANINGGAAGAAVVGGTVTSTLVQLQSVN